MEAPVPSPQQQPIAPTHEMEHPPTVMPSTNTMNSAANNSQMVSKPEDAAMHITVSDPVQHSEGTMNKYTSYRVDVNSNAHTPPTTDDIFRNPSSSAVLRRYSDFLWLYERLHKERPGSIVPPLPEKQAVARFSASFVEDRRVNLERFLRRVAVHPELYDATCLDTFLRADDITFQAMKNSKTLGGGGTDPSMMMSVGGAPQYGNASTAGSMMGMSVQPKKKDGIKKWFAETKASIAGDLVRSPDDDLFDEIDRYIEGLEKQMKNVQQHTSLLVKKDKEIANGLFEFGMAFNILGQSEADALGEGLTKMGATADGLSAVSLEHSEKEMANFEDPLKDYIKTIHAVKLALQKRHEKRVTYTTCLSEVAGKRSNLARLRSTPGSEARAYGADISLKRGEAAAEAAKEDFITVSQRVLREVDRFKREKGEAMKQTVLEYITLQVEYNKKMEEAWSKLLPQLEQIECGDGSSQGAVPSSVMAPAAAEGGVVEDFSQGQEPRQGQGQVPGQQQTIQEQPQMEQVPLDYQNQMPMNNGSQSMVDVGGLQYRDNNAGFAVHG